VLLKQLPPTLWHKSQHADLGNAVSLTQFGQLTKFIEVFCEWDKVYLRVSPQTAGGGNGRERALETSPNAGYTVMGFRRCAK
jgi:hypothetical protein